MSKNKTKRKLKQIIETELKKTTELELLRTRQHRDGNRAEQQTSDKLIKQSDMKVNAQQSYYRGFTATLRQHPNKRSIPSLF